jgi:hypothetical protein
VAATALTDVTRRDQYRLTAILALIAAALAYTAAAITFTDTGRVPITPLGGGTLMYVRAKKAE